MRFPDSHRETPIMFPRASCIFPATSYGFTAQPNGLQKDGGNREKPVRKTRKRSFRIDTVFNFTMVYVISVAKSIWGSAPAPGILRDMDRGSGCRVSNSPYEGKESDYSLNSVKNRPKTRPAGGNLNL